jgi:hypothetical protein
MDLDALPTAATLQVIHDDGVTVWVNGYEVLSRYMDNGLRYDAWASETADDNELSVAPLTLDSFNPFVIGPNTLAVMLKQVGPTSSDLSFDLQLAVQQPRPMESTPETPETPTPPTGVPPLQPEPEPTRPWGCQASPLASPPLVLLLIALCFRQRRHAWFNESATPL